MKLFMITVNIIIMFISIATIIVSLVSAQYGFAWLMVIPALYSGGNFWAIICDD